MSDDLPEDPWAADQIGAVETPPETPPPAALPPDIVDLLGFRLPTLLVHYRETANHMSQRDLAWHSHVDTSTINRIETGQVKPHDNTLRQLAITLAQHIDGGDASHILNQLIAARDGTMAGSKPPEALTLIADQVMAYPAWYRALVLRVLVAVAEGMAEAYKRLTRFR